MTSRAELVATILNASRELAAMGASGDELEAMEHVDEALVARDLIESFAVSCLRRLDRSVTLEEHGYGTATRFLIDVARMRRCEAGKRQTLVRMLALLPRTETAFAAGEIGFDHAVAIAYGCRTLDPSDLAAAEAILLDLARTSGTDEVIAASRRIRYLIGPDRYAKDRVYRAAEEHLRITPALYDQCHVHGLIPVSTAKQLQAVCDMYDRQNPADIRTREQRTLTAFQMVLDQQVTANVTVVVDVKDLTSEDGIGEFLDGTFVPAARIRDMATRGWLTRLMTADSRPLNVGYASRLATPAIRRAVTWRDRRCVVRGCTVPAERCQIDHTVEWEDGGVTSVENNALNCTWHNNWKHRHKDRVHREDHPDGTVEYLIDPPPGCRWRPLRSLPGLLTRSPTPGACEPATQPARRHAVVRAVGYARVSAPGGRRMVARISRHSRTGGVSCARIRSNSSARRQTGRPR